MMFLGVLLGSNFCVVSCVIVCDVILNEISLSEKNKIGLNKDLKQNKIAKITVIFLFLSFKRTYKLISVRINIISVISNV